MGHSDGISSPGPNSGPVHGRRRFLVGLVALGTAGSAAVLGWMRLQGQTVSETVAGRTATVSSLQSSVVETDDVDSALQPEPEADVEPSTTTEQPADTEPAGRSTVTIPVICRESWGAAAATAGFEAHTVQRLTVHHTASPITRIADGPGNIRSHQRFHQGNRGWPDIAYHFLVDPAGNIYQGRDPAFRGDTATNYDPSGHFLVCLEGNYDQAGVNDAQVTAVALILAWGASTYNVDTSTLAGHRDYADTQCPGDSVYRLLTDGSLAGRTEAVLAEGNPVLVDVCGADGAGVIAEIEASAEEL